MIKTVINYSNALDHVEAHATSGVAANFKALAAGTMAFMIGQTWQGDKALKVPTDQIKSDILARFRDSGDKKSKAYEFGALALTVAKELSKGDVTADRSWHTELRDIVQADGACLEDGVQFLADRFHSVADSVARLAAHFKGEKDKKPKAIDFMKSLESLCEKVLEEGGTIPAGAGIHLLLSQGVSAVDGREIIGRLMGALDSAALGELIEVTNATMVQRMAKESSVALATMESEMSGALDMAA